MPSTKELYGGESKYLSAKTFPVGQVVQVTITGVSVEKIREVDKYPKLVLQLSSGKSFAVNKTNSEILSQKFTDDYTTWVGKSFSLIRDQTKFKDELVPSLKVFG